MISLDHIQALIDHKHTLTAWCHSCRHNKVLDLQKLGERLGFQHSTMAADLCPKLKCTACGSRDVGLLLGPPEREANPIAGSSN